MATWTVKTHYKKSCQETEYWSRREGEGKLTVTNGFRYGEWTVETSDDNPPEFEFTEVPGGDGKKDSINMLDCSYNNIENVELVEMFDGGCWYDIEFEDLTDEEEEELQEFLDDNSTWDLEDRDEDPWDRIEAEWWIWGPIEIQDQDGNVVRIISADEEGNVIDFEEDK